MTEPSTNQTQKSMAHRGNIQLTILFTCGPEDVAAGDALFADHAEWMERSHPRDGDLALVAYNVVRGPELSNPLDPGSEPTGNTTFTLMEVYATQAGVANHWRMGTTEWDGFPAFADFAGKCKVTAHHGSEVVQSL